MKRIWIVAGLPILLFAAMAYAQTNTMDQASEKNVKITQGPTVSNITGNSATLHWSTDKTAANHVKYRPAGSGSWQSAYDAGGSKDHSVQLTGLQPGKTYEWQILTRDGDIRTSGQFQSAATANGTAPDVSASSTGGNPATPATPGAPSGGNVPLYRFDNSSAGEYVFSTSNSAPGGFTPGGTTAYLMGSQAPGTTPLYLLKSSNDAMLSTNPSEGGGTFQNSGGVGYIATSQQPGTQPLYRMVNPQTGKHFATASPQEHAQVLQKGWKDDGVLGYVWGQ